MYDTGVGRWLTRDPIGFEGGDANLSRYVGNDTPNATDPDGLLAKKPTAEQIAYGKLQPGWQSLVRELVQEDGRIYVEDWVSFGGARSHFKSLTPDGDGISISIMDLQSGLLDHPEIEPPDFGPSAPSQATSGYGLPSNPRRQLPAAGSARRTDEQHSSDDFLRNHSLYLSVYHLSVALKDEYIALSLDNGVKDAADLHDLLEAWGNPQRLPYSGPTSPLRKQGSKLLSGSDLSNAEARVQQIMGQLSDLHFTLVDERRRNDRAWNNTIGLLQWSYDIEGIRKRLPNGEKDYEYLKEVRQHFEEESKKNRGGNQRGIYYGGEKLEEVEARLELMRRTVLVQEHNDIIEFADLLATPAKVMFPFASVPASVGLAEMKERLPGESPPPILVFVGGPKGPNGGSGPKLSSSGKTGSAGNAQRTADSLKTEADVIQQRTQEKYGIHPNLMNMAKKPDIKFIDYLQTKYKLTDKQREILHEAITGQGLAKHEIEDMAKFVKDNYPNAK